MALYLGGDKVKINLNGVIYRLNLLNLHTEILNGVKLLSSDNYILLDSNGFYITAKKEE